MYGTVPVLFNVKLPGTNFLMIFDKDVFISAN
jgi:hypothetical protein